MNKQLKRFIALGLMISLASIPTLSEVSKANEVSGIQQEESISLLSTEVDEEVLPALIPKDLRVTEQSGDQIALTWDPIGSPFDHYKDFGYSISRVDVDSEGGEVELLYSSGSLNHTSPYSSRKGRIHDTSSFTDSSVENGKTYTYYVTYHIKNLRAWLPIFGWTYTDPYFGNSMINNVAAIDADVDAEKVALYAGLEFSGVSERIPEILDPKTGENVVIGFLDRNEYVTTVNFPYTISYDQYIGDLLIDPDSYYGDHLEELVQEIRLLNEQESREIFSRVEIN